MTSQPLSTEPVEDTPALFGLDEMVNAEDLSTAGTEDASPVAGTPSAPSAPGEDGASVETAAPSPYLADSSQIAPPIPSEQDFYRQELTRERQQRIYLEQQQQQLQMAQEAMAFRQNLEQQGIPSDQADYMARERQGFSLREFELKRQAQQQQEHLQGKMNAAFYYASQHPGIDPRALLQYHSPQDMEAAARQSTEIAHLRKEVAALKRSQVPAGQTFDNNQSSAGGIANDEAWIDTVYGDPSYIASPADHARARKYKETLR